MFEEEEEDKHGGLLFKSRLLTVERKNGFHRASRFNQVPIIADRHDAEHHELVDGIVLCDQTIEVNGFFWCSF